MTAVEQDEKPLEKASISLSLTLRRRALHHASFTKLLQSQSDKLVLITNLDLSGNLLTTLPSSFSPTLPHLHTLSLSSNQFTQFPEPLLQCQKLQALDLSLNQLEIISEAASTHALPFLRRLNLAGNRLTRLPDNLSGWKDLRILILGSECQLGNQLTEIPESIGALKNLIELDISYNQLTTLPAAIGQLGKLFSLSIYNNSLQSLPSSIKFFKCLQTLNLAKNQLQSLPLALITLTRLEFLDLSDNELCVLSTDMMAYMHSRFVLLAGNPFHATKNEHSSTPSNASSRLVPSLVELAARTIRSQPYRYRDQLSAIPALPPPLIEIIFAEGGWCAMCEQIYINEYKTRRDVQRNFLGHPHVPCIVGLCSEKCFEECARDGCQVSSRRRSRTACLDTLQHDFSLDW